MRESEEPGRQGDAKKIQGLFWPLAAVVIGVALAVTAGIVTYKVLTRPLEMVERGGASIKDGVLEIAGKGGEIIRKILSDPKIEERYYSFATAGRKVQELNVYKMERLECESKRIKKLNSEAHLGFIVPVEYAYYVDMSRKWRMTLENGVLKVVVPDLQPQRPNPFWEKCEEFIESGLLITNQRQKLKDMKNEFPKKLEDNAQRYCDQFIIQQARESVALFLNNWISESLKDHYISRISVKFESEKDFPKIEFSTSSSVDDALLRALSTQGGGRDRKL